MTRQLLLNAVCAANLLCLSVSAAHAQQAPGTQVEVPRLFEAEEVRADLAELYQRLQSAHYNLYENVGRDDYDRLLAQTSAAIDAPQSRAEAALIFQRFVAYGRIAHARVDSAFEPYFDYRAAGGRIFPLTLRFDGRRAFVIENRSGGAEPPDGAEVLTLDGHPMGDWFDRMARLLSADTDYLAGSLLEYYFSRLLWIDSGSKPAFAVTFREGDTIRQVTVPARSQAQIDAVRSPNRLRLDDTRTARMLDAGIAYLRPGPFYNTAEGAADMYDKRAFVSFIDTAFASFLQQDAKALIIDLRDNPGGDNSFSDHMVAWFATRSFRFSNDFRIKVSGETMASNAERLRASVAPADSPSARMAELYATAEPGQTVSFAVDQGTPRPGRRFAGRVYVLIDRHSYSNAVNTAALIQDHRFGTIIGEETADLATTLGAMETFTLSRTKINVGYPKARIIRASGNRLRRGVIPDIPIVTPVVQDSSDPVLSKAVAIIASKR